MTTTLTALAVAALTACTATTPTAPAPAPWETMTRTQSPASSWTAATRNGAWLYGDSISVANAYLAARLVYARTGRHVAVDANSGVPTKPAIDRLAERVRQRGAPPVVVMATGANDAVDPARARGMGSQIGRVRAIVGPRTRIVWVTALVARPKHVKADAAGTAAVNTAIVHAANYRRVDQVVHWHTALSRAGVSTHTRDGVHPVGKGSTLWAQTVAAAVR